MTLNPRIGFFGAAGEVTGSCFVIETGGRRVLVDCGLIQGTPEDEERNRAPLPFDPACIDAVVLTHAHLDHSGRLPLLVQAGYRGPIYTHAASSDLCRVLLTDAAYLNEKECEWENRKRERRHLPLLEPLYTMADAEAVQQHFRPLEYGQEKTIVPGVRLRLQDAGHILGSAIVEMWLEVQGAERKLVFSGDLGHHGAPILRDPALLDEADLVVMESTYGDRRHRSWEATWDELRSIVTENHALRGNILIPAFAVGRTQELLYAFKMNYREWGLDKWSIFVDSPMAIEATEIYSRHRGLFDSEAKRLRVENGQPFHLPNLHYSRTAAESMHINRIERGAIIIAGSGMCNGGRIKHHLKHNIWRRDCQVVIVGFQARGTLGRRLVDGAKQINLWGETISVSAHIHTVGGFSAHADCDGLAAWYGHFRQRPPVALVHGEPEAIAPLAQTLANMGARTVHRPEYGQWLDLATLPARA